MGGMNPRAYGPNPVSWVDPLGWCAAPNKIQLSSVDDILSTSTGNDVAFGVQKSLRNFTKKTGANSYYAWTNKGLSSADPMKRSSFTQAFQEATGNADRIIFNLDGLNVQRAYKLGQSGPFDLERNVTNWEFVNVLPNPKTIFVQNGKVVPLESVLQRVNK
jgi:uncharacterized protein RhaS with RHS repeats